MDELKKNEIYTAVIDGYTSDALGVCHIASRAVFVPHTVKGETWRVKILKVAATVCYGKAVELLADSPERRESVCPHYGICGGCGTMHMSYDEELRFKLSKVNDALKRIGRQTVTADTIIGSDSILHYRNKAVFAVSECGGRPAFGFYRERSHQLVDIGQCAIQNQLGNDAAAAVIAFMKAHDILPYDEASGKGCVRHIFCREAVNTGDAVLCIVAARGFGALTETLVDELRFACPRLTGIVLNINKTSGNSVLAGSFYTLWGSANIRDVLCGFSFDIAPQAFFQINPPQAEKLYRTAVDYACGGNMELAFDLYCGAGTISLCLAEKFRKVIGAEIVSQAVENATVNAALNRVDNVEFIRADAAEAALELSKRDLAPDVILVDPPRKGMYEAAVAATADMGPERIVYVSCNPATLARDILRFNEYGYNLIKVTAVDMFPRTDHVETVALMQKSYQLD